MNHSVMMINYNDKSMFCFFLVPFQTKPTWNPWKSNPSIISAGCKMSERARKSYGKSWCCWRYNSNSNWGIHLWRYCHAWHLFYLIFWYICRDSYHQQQQLCRKIMLKQSSKNGGTHRRRLSKTSPSFGAADVARSGASSRTTVHVMSHFKSKKCQKAMVFGLYTIQSSNIKLSFFVG